MTVPSKIRELLNKFRYVYHIKLAEKRGVRITCDSINLLKSDIKIQKKVSRLIFLNKFRDYLNIKKFLKKFK